jgi:ferredoxin-nitrate reductase
MSGLSHERLQREGALQWPCPTGESEADAALSKRLYTDLQFPTSDGRARFIACDALGMAEPTDEDYPFVLTVGRLYGHWHTQTRTGRTEKIVKMYPQPFLEIHPQDAEQLGICDRDWVEVRSRRGSARFPVQITVSIRQKTLFAPMHWGSLWAENAEANHLTHPEACPISREPELKACAVTLVLLQKGDRIAPVR